MYRHTVVCIGGISHNEELIPLVTGVSISGEKVIMLKEILYTSAKTEITHDASVQLDHSEMIVYVTMQIVSFFTSWMRLASKAPHTLWQSHTRKVHLPSGKEGPNDLGLKLWTLIMFVKWTSVFTCGWAFLLYFVNFVYTFISFVTRIKRACPLFVILVAPFCLLSVSGMFCSPGPNKDILAVRMEHSAIGHRLSATKVYENNVPSLDWHGLKNFKDFEEFVNVSFFYPNSWTAPKAQDGYINKFISPKKKKKPYTISIYTFRFCFWSALCMSNTILTVL